MERSRTTPTTPSPGAPLAWRAFVTGGLATMAVLSTNDEAWRRFDGATGGRLPRRTVRTTLVATGAVHAAEAVAVGRRAAAAGLPHPGRWARQTLLWGFPVLLRLRRAERA